MKKPGLHERYGGSALVTGSARGIGRAFATTLAAEGFDLVLVDQLKDENESLAEELARKYAVRTEVITCDLGSEDLVDEASEWASAHDVGLLINNAGIAPMGLFLRIPLDAHLKTLNLNARATLVLTHVFGRAMARRGRGGIVIVSSQSALTGSPYFAHYAATKGYGLNLAHGLWAELRRNNIDVLGLCPGLTNTEPVQALGLDESLPAFLRRTEPGPVAQKALEALGTRASVVPMWLDRASSYLLSRVLPRRWTLSVLERTLRDHGPGHEGGMPRD